MPGGITDHFTDKLGSLHNLLELDISNRIINVLANLTSLGDKGVKLFSNALNKMIKLQSLGMGNNNITLLIKNLIYQVKMKQ